MFFVKTRNSLSCKELGVH